MEHQAIYSRDPDTTRYNLAVLSRYFPGPVDEIDADAVQAFIAARKADDKAGGTVNRQLATLSRGLILAIRKGWHPGPNPVRAIQRLREATPQTPYYTEAEMQALLNNSAPHLQQVTYTALMTMARRREILTLEWPQVKMDSRFIAFLQENTKARKERPVPICDGLYEVLLSIGPRPTGRVFVYRGRPIRSVKSAFHTAKIAAGLPFLRFRDLRHVGSCWFMENGGKLEELQAILGHSDPKLTRRYGRYSKGYISTLARHLGPPTFTDKHP